MEFSIKYVAPDSVFWDDYTELWLNSRAKSVFQAPHFIRFLTTAFEDSFALYTCYNQKTLIGAAFFRKEKNTFRFLSDVRSDQNFFVLRDTCTKEESAFFFNSFFGKIKEEKWSLFLKKCPAGNGSMEAFLKAAKSSGMFYENYRYAVCPVLEKESPQELYESINKSKEVEYKAKQLERQKNAVLEVFTDDRDLDDWAGRFFDLHIKRWEDTPTPSDYQKPAIQNFYKDCMRAWIRDGALVRFALIVNEERIALNMALRQGLGLIGRAQVFDPAYKKFSPGKILLYHLGQWMLQENLVKLDFGDGNDAYKYEYTNKSTELLNIHVCMKNNLPFILKSKINKSIRENQGIYHFYRDTLKPLVHKINL
jgi:Acetyltransferase (GNAT) domain